VNSPNPDLVTPTSEPAGGEGAGRLREQKDGLLPLDIWSLAGRALGHESVNSVAVFGEVEEVGDSGQIQNLGNEA